MKTVLSIGRSVQTACDIELEHSCDVSLGQLVQLCGELGIPLSHDALYADSGRLSDRAVVGSTGLRSGSRITNEPVRTTTRGGVSRELRVIAGPDAGGRYPIPDGELMIGRDGECAVRLRDPHLSRRHARLTADSTAVWISDADSSNGTILSGRTLGPQPHPWQVGEELAVGDSRLQLVDRAEPLAAVRTDGSGNLLVNRPPQVRDNAPDEPIRFPDPPSAGVRARLTLMASVLPALAGVALALAMRNVQFLAFALLTPLTLIAGHVGDRVHGRQTNRRAQREYIARLCVARTACAAALGEEAERRREAHPDPAEVASIARGPGRRLWLRRPSDEDFLTVRLGLADAEPQLEIAGRDPDQDKILVRAVPVVVSLREGPAGIWGPAGAVEGSARWVVTQLAAMHSPNDLQLHVIVSDADEQWRWLRWLGAHLRSVATSPAEHQSTVNGLLNLAYDRRSTRLAGGRWPGPWAVLVIDPARAAACLPGLSTLLEIGPAVGITAICLDTDQRLLAAPCRQLVGITSNNAIDAATLSGGFSGECHPELVSCEWAEEVARSLAPLRDADRAATTSFPDQVQLARLLNLRPDADAAIQQAWAGARDTSFLLGVGASGPISVDLVRDGPHALIAGTTGSGKSELLRTMVASLAASNPPEDVAFVLIDYKGGATFNECTGLPHTLAVITDLDPHLTQRALTSLEAELRGREQLFASVGAANIADYRASADDEQPPLPRLLLIVDEFAALAEELPDFLHGLISIAQRGRSLGVHLVLATQKPGGVVSPEIKANVALRIALRVTDSAESQDVIGSDAAFRISPTTPGRAVACLAGGAVEFQTATITQTSAAGAAIQVRRVDMWNRPHQLVFGHSSGGTDFDLLAKAVQRAARVRPGAPLRPPWLPPLPDQVTTVSASQMRARVPYALVDDPSSQSQYIRYHDVREPTSIAFVGGPRSGRTGALRMLLTTAAQQLGRDQLHLYVIDCAGGGLKNVSRLNQCGTVASSDHPATIAALLTGLDRELIARRSTLSGLGVATAAEADSRGFPMPPVLLAVDGWEALVETSEESDAGRSVETLLRLARDGACAGFSIVLSGDRGLLGFRVSSVIQHRYLLRLTDRSDYVMAGLVARAVPLEFPPGRAVELGSGLEVQLMTLSDSGHTSDELAVLRQVVDGQPVVPPPAARLIRIRPLPRTVGLAEISSPNMASPSGVVLGVGGYGAEPVRLDLLADRRPFLICGPVRSGRSTAATLIGAHYATQGRRVVVTAPARSPLRSWATVRGIPVIAPTASDWTGQLSDAELVVVDDCDAFVDTVVGDALEQWAEAGAATFIVVARSDDLAVSFRGLGVLAKRHRSGLLLQPGPADGDHLGIRVPNVRESAPPGRGVLVHAETIEDFPGGMPIQLAVPSARRDPERAPVTRAVEHPASAAR